MSASGSSGCGPMVDTMVLPCSNEVGIEEALVDGYTDVEEDSDDETLGSSAAGESEVITSSGKEPEVMVSLPCRGLFKSSSSDTVVTV